MVYGTGLWIFFLISDGAYGLIILLSGGRERERVREREREIECVCDGDRER